MFATLYLPPATILFFCVFGGFAVKSTQKEEGGTEWQTGRYRVANRREVQGGKHA